MMRVKQITDFTLTHWRSTRHIFWRYGKLAKIRILPGEPFFMAAILLPEKTGVPLPMRMSFSG